MIINKVGDILSDHGESTIICHQVNCQGKMGSGLAKQIRSKYPVAYNYYMQDYNSGRLQLGCVTFVPCDVNKQVMVANMCGQDRYGYDGKKYTNYEALEACLKDVNITAKAINHTVAIPKYLGCGLGGGDWKVVSKLIEDAFQDVDVTIYELGE